MLSLEDCYRQWRYTIIIIFILYNINGRQYGAAPEPNTRDEQKLSSFVGVEIGADHPQIYDSNDRQQKNQQVYW